MSDLPVVLGITGGSGVVYAQRLLGTLLQSGAEVHLVVSPAARQVFAAELGTKLAEPLDPKVLTDAPTSRLRVWPHHDLAAGIASGSFRTRGMVIAPCSMSTLGALASGQSTNLIHRAAEVHLKERRRLILVPRETPLSLIGLENMVRVTRAGAIVLPAAPGFYHRPQTIDDLVAFVVARILDQLGLDNDLIRRWGGVRQ